MSKGKQAARPAMGDGWKKATSANTKLTTLQSKADRGIEIEDDDDELMVRK
jgi:hypothetical protein